MSEAEKRAKKQYAVGVFVGGVSIFLCCATVGYGLLGIAFWAALWKICCVAELLWSRERFAVFSRTAFFYQVEKHLKFLILGTVLLLPLAFGLIPNLWLFASVTRILALACFFVFFQVCLYNSFF